MIYNLFQTIRWEYSSRSHRPSRLGRAWTTSYPVPSGVEIYWTLTKGPKGWTLTSMLITDKAAHSMGSGIFPTWEGAAHFVWLMRIRELCYKKLSRQCYYDAYLIALPESHWPDVG